MTRSATLKLLFNTGGVLLGLFLVGYMLLAGFYPETDASCRATYPPATQLSLRNAKGELISPIELQARASHMEWGTMRNTSVVAEGADGAALQVKLATLTEIEGGLERETNGVHFDWKFAPLAAASSVCLSYAVWLPTDFDFEKGGVLPGIVGDEAGTVGNANRFATRVRWRGDGSVALDVARPADDFDQASMSHASLTRGRWARIDQEVVLNKPEKSNGRVRMWIDGEEAGEEGRIMLRKDKNSRFLGVYVDVGYLRDPAKTGELRLSAFQISWR